MIDAPAAASGGYIISLTNNQAGSDDSPVIPALFGSLRINAPPFLTRLLRLVKLADRLGIFSSPSFLFASAAMFMLENALAKMPEPDDGEGEMVIDLVIPLLSFSP
jgi:hypothetical protein